MGETVPTVGWIGRHLHGRDGKRIGTVADVYLDVRSGRPSWLVLHTGRLRRRVRFVPVVGVAEDDDRLVSDHTREEVRSAPIADPDGRLQPGEEDALHTHYGLTFTEENAR